MVGAIRTRYVSPTQKERLANLSSTMLANTEEEYRCDKYYAYHFHAVW